MIHIDDDTQCEITQGSYVNTINHGHLPFFPKPSSLAMYISPQLGGEPDKCRTNYRWLRPSHMLAFSDYSPEEQKSPETIVSKWYNGFQEYRKRRQHSPSPSSMAVLPHLHVISNHWIQTTTPSSLLLFWSLNK